uniref:Uncharacterized protein n=1 Tax=Panagrolaimus sp. ES5 TaxID=591445 RepID=A0AC34F8U4_9BILA
MTSVPNDRWFERSFGFSSPPNASPRDFRRPLFSESEGSTQGLAIAYDSFPSTSPGIYHKHQVQRRVSPVNYVIPDRRMPSRCPCCGTDAQLYCSTCVLEHFLRPHNFARRRDQLNRRKAEIGTQLKQILEPEANDQAQIFQKRRKIAELRERINEKRDNIQHLKELRDSKSKEVQRNEKNVSALKRKMQTHKERIIGQKQAEEELRKVFSKACRDRHQIIAKYSQQLSTFFPVIESAPQGSNDNPDNKIQQMIEEAGFADKSKNQKYSEVAKRMPTLKTYFKVRGCLVPGENDYSDVLTEIVDHRALASRSSRETIAGLAYTAQFVNAISYLYDLYFYLLTLKKRVKIGKMPRPIAVFHPKDDRLHKEIVTELKQLSWLESAETGFDVNDVEDDWVDVVKTH